MRSVPFKRDLQWAIAGRPHSKPPPVLVKYRLEQALWSQLGLRLRDFEDRPKQELVDYITIMQLEREEEERRQEMQLNQAKAQSGRR